MVSCFSVIDGLERLQNDDNGLFSDKESDCEADGIVGYMPEVNDDLMADIARKGSMDVDASSSAITNGVVYR